MRACVCACVYMCCGCSAHKQVVISVCFGPGAKWIATASFDNSVILSSVATGALLCSARTPDGAFPWTLSVVGAKGPQFNQKKNMTRPPVIAAGCHDGSLLVWHAEERRGNKSTEMTLAPSHGEHHAHAGPVYSVSITPCGGFAATAGEDGAVRLWALDDVISCRETWARPRMLGQYEHHVAAVTAVDVGAAPPWLPRGHARALPRSVAQALLCSVGRAAHTRTLPRLPPELWRIVLHHVSPWHWLGRHNE